MKITSTGAAARGAYYDRNPTSKVQQFANAGVAPHSAVTRWTYTVPAGRKAIVESATAMIYRDAAATTAGIGQNAIRVTPSGGAATVIDFAEILLITLGTVDRCSIGSVAALATGDVVDATDLDTAVGGSCRINASAKITEFDA